MLEQGDCSQIHHASCEILHKVGVEIHNPEGIELFRTAGVEISDNLVKIPTQLVEQSLKSTPRNFNLYKRGSDEIAMKLDGEAVYFGSGSDTLHYLDPRTGERREFMLEDVADCVRVCDALPEIDFVMSMGIPRDVPAERYYRYQYATILRHTTKPFVVVCNNLTDFKAIVEMAAAVVGGMDQLSQYPNILLYSEPSTPLRHSREAIDKLLYAAKHAIPVTHSPAPMMGGTAPVTLAGAVALGNAEMLSGLVLHQLKNPGAPFLYGHGVHHLDMKSMVSVYGAPEFQLARVMAAEMGRFYKLPIWGYAGHSDSKVIDGQAAVDAQFSVMVALLAKTNLNHDVGYLESGLTHSPEMVVLVNEIIAMCRRFAGGVRIDNESLAVDVIQAVGPGGNFITHRHTANHWRELWVPKIFDRQRLDIWNKQGSKNLNATLREVTVALLENLQVKPLPESVDHEIESILNR